MKYRFLQCLFFIELSISFLYAQDFLTQAEKDWIEANPVIRIHNEMNWPPFNFNINGHPKGLSIDYMNLLAEKIGISIAVSS